MLASLKIWNVEELETLPAGTLPGSRRKRKHFICISETERGPERSCKINTHGRMHFWWSLCTLYLHACRVRVTVGDSGLCCCTCVTYFEPWLAPLCVDLYINLYLNSVPWAELCFYVRGSRFRNISFLLFYMSRNKLRQIALVIRLQSTQYHRVIRSKACETVTIGGWA